MALEANVPFEVEIRCHFESQEAAYTVLPFLHDCLQSQSVPWVSRIFGLSVFKSGQLLRVAEVVRHGKSQYYLGWKGPDVGQFANIRREIDEECTHGIVDSAILRKFGADGDAGTPDAAARKLEELGHKEFMSFSGSDLAGYDKSLGVSAKLMVCPVLRWPVLVELEKMASTEQEAIQREAELRELSLGFRLQSRLVREEPPTLLYTGLFAH
jgi:hypothetical protein